MKIGVVTADPKLLAVVQEGVRRCGHQACQFASLGKALDAKVGLVFCEWLEGTHLPEILQGLQAVAEMPIPIPVIALVSSGGVVTMRRAQAAGATDALPCPPEFEEIQAEIEEASARAGGRDTFDRALFQEILQESLVGEGPNFRRCLEEMKQAARCDANVLLVGETGTGKEMVARGIHRLSHRASEPYLAVNCASLPETLLESELFGHAKGAFTGAQATRGGRFEAVGAGTLLLDEIGDLETALQMKLLRVIEQREFQRVGENTTLKFHGRLVCATSVDLSRAVEGGRFRRDLLGRVDQFRITLPPLRERRLDIPILIRHFLRKHSQARKVDISRPAMDLLESYDYPMNIRQLENAVVSALARSDPGKLILPQHLPADLKKAQPSETKAECHLLRVDASLGYEEARASAGREIDRIYLGALLAKHHGNQSRAAEEVGIDRGTLGKRVAEALGKKGEETSG
jgi:DNA-binding NtrC family response regulator